MDDTLVTIAEALEAVLSDVKLAIAAGQRLDGTTLCGATRGLHDLVRILTDALAQEAIGFNSLLASLAKQPDEDGANAD